MNERETERLLEILSDINRNIENGLERINDSLKKISEEIKIND